MIQPEAGKSGEQCDFASLVARVGAGDVSRAMLCVSAAFVEGEAAWGEFEECALLLGYET